MLETNKTHTKKQPLLLANKNHGHCMMPKGFTLFSLLILHYFLWRRKKRGWGRYIFVYRLKRTTFWAMLLLLLHFIFFGLLKSSKVFKKFLSWKNSSVLPVTLENNSPRGNRFCLHKFWPPNGPRFSRAITVPRKPRAEKVRCTSE